MQGLSREAGFPPLLFSPWGIKGAGEIWLPVLIQTFSGHHEYITLGRMSRLFRKLASIECEQPECKSSKLDESVHPRAAIFGSGMPIRNKSLETDITQAASEE